MKAKYKILGHLIEVNETPAPTRKRCFICGARMGAYHMANCPGEGKRVVIG